MPDDLATLMRTWRHDLHARPEQGFAEHATSDYVAGVLADLGLDVVRGVGGTGVVATLARGGTTSVGLRADMDALASPSAARTGRTAPATRARCTPAATTGTWRCCSAPRTGSCTGTTSRARSGSCSSPPRSTAAAPARWSTTGCSPGSPSTRCSACTTPPACRPATWRPGRAH